MKDNIVKKKSFEFALRIIKLNKFLCSKQNEYVLSKQLLKSGTSIGANIREAEQGCSRADFIYKLSIALKEANETDYWLELLNKSDYISDDMYKEEKEYLDELLKLLVSIIKSSKRVGN